ncbi:hypothetical protein, partial [Porphyromonas loveana]|uniref:hypothetical protein n=1 Tax=Porphyromonas loveana TaxID=1884669 RepID=UPI0035A15677
VELWFVLDMSLCRIYCFETVVDLDIFIVLPHFFLHFESVIAFLVDDFLLYHFCIVFYVKCYLYKDSIFLELLSGG